MKKLLLGIFIIVMCFTVTGCDEAQGKLSILCNGESETVEAKKNSKFTCKLAGEEYEFKITKIKSNNMIIEANKPGLSKVTKQGTISLLTEETEFVVEEGTELGLSPQALDNFEIIIIYWEK